MRLLLRKLCSGFLLGTVCLFLVPGLAAETGNGVNNSRAAPIKNSNCPGNGRADAVGYFEVCQVDISISGGVYNLNARLYFGMSVAASDALKSGVPITLQVQIEIFRHRDWVWDETVATLSQKYRLQYHSLSEQYVVTNVNTSAQTSFGSARAAIESISEVEHLPVIDRNLLRPNEVYYGRTRIRLVIRDLPSPLRFWAYLSREWRLKSDWYQWQL